jgi:hypothetical protein
MGAQRMTGPQISICHPAWLPSLLWDSSGATERPGGLGAPRMGWIRRGHDSNMGDIQELRLYCELARKEHPR